MFCMCVSVSEFISACLPLIISMSCMWFVAVVQPVKRLSMRLLPMFFMSLYSGCYSCCCWWCCRHHHLWHHRRCCFYFRKIRFLGDIITIRKLKNHTTKNVLTEDETKTTMRQYDAHIHNHERHTKLNAYTHIHKLICEKESASIETKISMHNALKRTHPNQMETQCAEVYMYIQRKR